MLVQLPSDSLGSLAGVGTLLSCDEDTQAVYRKVHVARK